jgi:hypothetical protein
MNRTPNVKQSTESNTAASARFISLPAFKKADLFVYAALALIIILLFLLLRPLHAAALDFVEFRVDGISDAVFTVSTADNKYYISPDFSENISVERDGGGLLVTVHAGGGFNSVRILPGGEVYVSDADCSLHKDCTKFPHITRSGMSIICVPHGLSIIGVGSADAPDPVTG